MCNHAIQLYIEGHWITVLADSLQEALALRESSMRVARVPSRRVVITAEGHTLIADAE